MRLLSSSCEWPDDAPATMKRVAMQLHDNLHDANEHMETAEKLYAKGSPKAAAFARLAAQAFQLTYKNALSVILYAASRSDQYYRNAETVEAQERIRAGKVETNICNIAESAALAR